MISIHGWYGIEIIRWKLMPQSEWIDFFQLDGSPCDVTFQALAMHGAVTCCANGASKPDDDATDALKHIL